MSLLRRVYRVRREACKGKSEKDQCSRGRQKMMIPQTMKQ